MSCITLKQSIGFITSLLLAWLPLATGCTSPPGPPDPMALQRLIRSVESHRLAVAANARPHQPAPRYVGLFQPDPSLGTARTCPAQARSDPQITPASLTLASHAVDHADPPADRAAGPASRPLQRGPLDSLRATIARDLKQMPERLWRDTRRTYWDATNAVVLLTAGGASLALRPEVDDDFEDKFRRSRALSPEWGDLGGAISNPALHFALAGAWYLTGAVQHDAKTYEVGKTLFSALIINGLSTMLLKTAAWTDAPNGEPLAWPSGHVSSMVCLAAVLDDAYGPWLGWPLYGAAGFAAFERMDDREHHFSDIVFGAALGWVVGHAVATGHQPEIFGGQVLPYADSTTGSAGLIWARTFK